MRPLRTVVALLGVVAGCAAWVAASEEKRPMTFVDLLEVPVLTDPRLSPDGRHVVYVLAEPDWKANRRIEHVWRVRADGSESRQVTNGEEGETSPRWSPDGTTLAFIAKRGEVETKQIYIIENSLGEARRLTDHTTDVSQIQWSPDGEWLYFLAHDPKTEEQRKREVLKDDVIAFDEDYRQRHLWRVSVPDGAEERMSAGDFSIVEYRLSRDGTRIVEHRAPTPLFDDWDESEIWVSDVDEQNGRRLTENHIWEQDAELSPDNTDVLFLARSNEDFEPYYNNNLFLISAEGGRSRLLLPELPHEIREATWAHDGRVIYFTANTGVRSELFQVDVATETTTRLTQGDHAVRNWSFSPSAGRHVFTLDTASNPGEVWTAAARGGGEASRVTAVYEYLSREYRLPRQEAIQWKGADGVAVEGLLYYPLDYRDGERYALAVQSHGGPASSDRFGFGRWRDYIPVLTARGYFVLKPNYRGSTGYGDEFLRDMVGHYFRNAHLDVMAGVDHLIEQGLVDGDRMVKMGWSGGGHMTNKIITFTDRFKAASSGAGAVNWVSMYGQSDVRIYRTPWFGGTPWQEDAPIDVYWEHSPLKDIWKVTTPTIIFVGENDERVPPPQSIELFRALKSNGVPTHLYIAPREPHGWEELGHQLFKMNVELDWFEEHAMGRELTWETPPEPPEPAPSTGN